MSTTTTVTKEKGVEKPKGERAPRASSGYRNRKRKYAKYPSCFGKLDTRGIFNVAVKHGMEVITCRKPDMHCYNEVGLYGTPDQMEAVEAEWTANGNEPKPRGFKAVFKVNLDVPRERWASVEMEAAKVNKISTRGGTVKARTKRGRQVTLPPGYRALRDREMPRKSDIAWNEGAEQFEPIDWEDVERCGKQFFKRHANLIARAV